MKKDIKINVPRTEGLRDADLNNPHLCKQILAASGVAMSIRGKGMRPTYANQAFMDFYGYTLEELRNKPLEEVLPEETHTLYRTTINPTLLSGISWEGEYAICTKAGQQYTVWSRFDPVFDEQGELTHVISVMRDASGAMQLRTALSQTESAIQQSEARFRTLFEDSPISLWEEDLTRLKVYFDELKAKGVTDFRQHFYDHPEDLGKCATLVDVVDINKATLDLLRAKSREELLGNLDLVLTESSMAAFTEEMILLASGGCEYCGEITHRTLDGEIIWVVVHFSVPAEYQETLSRVIVSLLDVTPRKRAEQALMESEERYRALVENAQEGVAVISHSQPVFVNEAMADILGYTVDELKALTPMDVIHPEDREHVAEQLTEYLAGTRKEGFATCRVLTGPGATKWITMNVKPIMWGGEEAELEMLTDVTAHKALEEELRTAHSEMEERVKIRTAELESTNRKLQVEIEEREKAQEHILSLTQQIIRIQEDERQRIARDLHDKVAQDLSSIVLNMETLFDGHDGLAPELHKRGENVVGVVQGAIAAVRDIAYGLRPPALDQLGLTRALKNHCQEMSGRNGLSIDFFAVGIEDITLDFDAEINIYRMIQEALNNIVKHAHATRATVRLVKSHPDILIRIEDNGQGFDMETRADQGSKGKCMGLRSMEERARLIGGSMEIRSLVGTGTRIVFTIPLGNSRRQ